MLKKKEWIIFSFTITRAPSQRAEKINIIHQLNLDLQGSDQGQGKLSNNVSLSLLWTKRKPSILCATGGENQEVPWQVCLSSTSAVLSCTLSCSPCHSSLCHLMWWTCLAIRLRGGRTGIGGSLLCITKQKLLNSLTNSNSYPTLLDHHDYCLERKWLGDVILWVCWLDAQRAIDKKDSGRAVWFGLELSVREKNVWQVL